MARIQIEGARELRKALRGMPKELRQQLREVYKDAARPVAQTAAAIAPHRSGALAASIRPLASQRAGRVAAGKKAVPYAGPIHFGWPARRITPQPFLYDALDRRGSEVVDKFEDRVDKLINANFKEGTP